MDDAARLVADLAGRARAASRILARASTAQKAAALRGAATAIRRDAAVILTANAEDMKLADKLSPALRDRLQLDEGRLEAVAAAMESIASLRNPVGETIDERVRPNGLHLARVRVPIGVLAIIYESRPNVTADAGALALMSGNAAILRGGSEARASNAALHAALVAGIGQAGLPTDAVQLVPTTDRAVVGAMLEAAGKIDLIIPRGGKSLVARVQADARIPVLAHLEGNNHVYVDGAADPAMAQAIAVNAKLRRTGVCGAMETLLIDRAFPNGKALVRSLLAGGCALRGDTAAETLDDRITPASDADWDTEYLDAIANVALVDGINGAIAHIAAHGSGHTDAIVTDNDATAERFLAEVDSAIVLHNASTQFADGGEFGLGAEIGIATGRLHARGPVALEGLTTYKWVGRGTGQIRP